MSIGNIDFSKLINGSPRDFSDDLDAVNDAHRMVNEIRQLIWEGEATFNLRVKFENMGLPFDNKMSNKDILKKMNQLDLELMHARASIRAKKNKGIGYYNNDTKYENGFTPELIRERVDLSPYTDLNSNIGDGKIDVASIPYDRIELCHTEIMNLRELFWVDFIEFNGKLYVDGILLGDATPSSEEYLELLDGIDLKLREVKIAKQTLDSQRPQNGVSRNGSRATVLPTFVLKIALQDLSSEEIKKAGDEIYSGTDRE